MSGDAIKSGPPARAGLLGGERPQNDDRLVDVRYREAGSLIAAPEKSANHTEIPALFKAGSVMLGVSAQK
jgi:hypothetical protein